MKTNTNLISRLLLSCLLLFIFNFSAQAQGQWPYPSPGAPFAGSVAPGADMGNYENPDSQIWVKVNGNIAGPTPHNKMHSSKTTVGAASFVTAGATVEVNFNVNKNKNRFTLVSYAVNRTTGLRTLFDYQSNLYNNGSPVQGNSNQQKIKVPYNCDWEVYLVKGGIESNTGYLGTPVPGGSPAGSFMSASLPVAPNGIITGPVGNPYAYNNDGVNPAILRTGTGANSNRILDYTYGSGADLAHCEVCPQITDGNGILDISPNDNNQVYFRLVEVIHKQTTKELIFSVINTTNTKDTKYVIYDYIGDVLFSNILPAHHPRNNTPYQFRYNYQAGPQIQGYTVNNPPTGLSYGPKDAFVFDQRNNHNNLDYGTYQSELFMFEVTNSVYNNLGAPGAPQAEICAELSSKHPEPGKTLHPVFCADIDFCAPPCPVTRNEDCHYTDCCFDIAFAGGVPGPSPSTTTLRFDAQYLLTCNRSGTVNEVIFTFPDVVSLPAGITNNINTTAGFTFSVVNNTVVYSGNLSTALFAFDMPSSFFSPAIDNILITLNSSGTTLLTNSFPLTIETDPNNPVGECGLIVVLPVELTTFTGKAISEGIALNWKTASEKNNDRFEIERSSDGRNFEKIGDVKGNGTSNLAHSYSFLDKYAQAGINYYRLNQVDFGGTNERSHIIRVSAEKAGTGLGVQLIPNPCQDQNCTVQLRNIDTSAPITVELRDLTGRLIFSQQVPADQNSFQLPRVDSGNGIYILSARNGSYTAYQKIVIQ